MECKSYADGDTFDLYRELIDTLWNVNINTVCPPSRFETELIDTLWNVNKHWFKGFLDSDAELIDTLWNVNTVK